MSFMREAASNSSIGLAIQDVKKKYIKYLCIIGACICTCLFFLKKHVICQFSAFQSILLPEAEHL